MIFKMYQREITRVIDEDEDAKADSGVRIGAKDEKYTKSSFITSYNYIFLNTIKYLINPISSYFHYSMIVKLKS